MSIVIEYCSSNSARFKKLNCSDTYFIVLFLYNVTLNSNLCQYISHLHNEKCLNWTLDTDIFPLHIILNIIYSIFLRFNQIFSLLIAHYGGLALCRICFFIAYKKFRVQVNFHVFIVTENCPRIGE